MPPLTDLCRSQLNNRNNDFPFCNPKTASEDCNVAMTSQAVELVTGEKMTSLEVRTLGGAAMGPTGNRMTREVFLAKNMLAGTDFQMLSNTVVQNVRDLLDAGWAVTIYIDYGYMQDHAPQFTGDQDYRGAHAVQVFDWWRGQHGRMVHEADPTFDGRMRGKWTAPKGVQSVPFPILREAAFNFTGHHGIGGLISGWAVLPKG